MRWQRVARWLVAAAGVGTAIALYTQTRERPAVDRPTVATPADPDAAFQSGEGKDVRFRSGEVVFEMTYASLAKSHDGRLRWTKARFSLDDGTVACADVIEASGEMVDGQPAEMTLSGNVCLDTAEGASIRTSEATYNGRTGVAIMPGPVTFSRGRMAGGGTGGEYHRDTGVFHVLADARVETAAGDGADRVEATARSMTFNRASQALLFDQNARIAHQKQTMTADRATLYLADNQDQFRVIELRGRSAVVPVRGHEAEVPEMRARDIDLAFHEGTQALERAVLVGGSSVVLVEGGGRRSIEATDVTLATAPDGRTLTSIEARERVTVRTPTQAAQAARTITAAHLVTTGHAGGLTAATFTGGVRFVETEPARGTAKATEREGRSQALTLKLGGQLDDVQSAQFQQNVEFRAGDVSGDGDLGDYEAAAGRLVLRPGRVPSRLPHVTSGRVTVDAREFIDVDLDTANLHARGDVKTVSRADPAAGRGTATGGSGLFNPRDTMLGFAAEFWYAGEDERVRYRGTETVPARLTQGDTAVSAESIELSEATEDLTARGQVDSTFSMSQPRSGAVRRWRVSAATLEYREKTRTATYTGSPVVLTAPDGTTRAQTMVMTLAAEGRTIERLDARGEVHAVMPGGREALSESLLYDAPLDRYTLRGIQGRPLVLRGEGDTPGTCSQWRGRMAYFTNDGGPPVFPGDENVGGVERRDVPCTGPLQH